MRVVDCQGFAGGFTMGAVQAGLELVGKVENVGGFGMAQCEANRVLLGDTWEGQVGAPNTWHALPDVDVIIANPPCSGFSQLSNPGFRGVGSRINSCMWDAMQYAAKTRPKIYVMESVRAAFTKGLPLMRELRRGMEELTGERWDLHHVVHDAYAVGGCQKRGRYFMVLSRVPFGVENVQLTAQPTVADAISDLVDQPLNWDYEPYVAPPTWWSYQLRSDGGGFHGADPTEHFGVDGHALPLGGENNWILDLLDPDPSVWKQGRAECDAARAYYETFGKFPESWHVRTRLTRALGVRRTLANRALEDDFNFGMFQAKRWKWHAPGWVITGAGPFQGIHPVLPRYFTHREIARMMGFPDTWLIAPLRTDKTLQAGWGKGVTVHCGEWISRWVKSSIEGSPGIEQAGRRVSSFDRTVADEDREWFIDVSKHWKNAPLSPATIAAASVLREENVA